MTRVLLVEDDKNLSFILKSSLEQMIGGYEVLSVANGKNGLDMLTKENFDVIVSDVEMPVMDGVTMVQHIRKNHPSLAIIFITGLTTARDVINGYQAGADFYIKNTRDLLMDKKISQTSGFSEIKTNAGSIRNTGIELSISGTPIRMRWTCRLQDMSLSKA